MDQQIFTEHGMNTKKDLEIPLITTGLVFIFPTSHIYSNQTHLEVYISFVIYQEMTLFIYWRKTNYTSYVSNFKGFLGKRGMQNIPVFWLEMVTPNINWLYLDLKETLVSMFKVISIFCSSTTIYNKLFHWKCFRTLIEIRHRNKNELYNYSMIVFIVLKYRKP